jgi:AcrR family transcriptional regulator
MTAAVRQRRPRATAMAPEERRESIVDATLRLVARRDTPITTQAIAREVGTAEGTLFRAFTTKEELIAACLERVLASDPILDDLDAAAALASERQRAIAACDALRRHLLYVGPTLEALGPLGIHDALPAQRAAFMDLLIAKVEHLLAGRGAARTLRAMTLVYTMMGVAARDNLPGAPKVASAKIVDTVLGA